MRIAAYLALALVASAAGCGDPRPGIIRGDLFLAEDLGREVDLAGAPVRLVADDDSLDAALARLCPAGADAAAAPPPDEARAWRERARILQARTRRTVTTDAQARFVFDSVPPGEYRLWADTTVKAARWTWLQPVEVEAGDSVRVALSNANPDENPFRCGFE